MDIFFAGRRQLAARGRMSIIIFQLLCYGFACIGWAQASSMDTTSRDLLIRKLNRVYMNLSATDGSRLPVSLRLADLLSERARLANIQELNAGCNPCLAGEEDRNQAIQLYRDAVPQLMGKDKGRVLLQLGHLLELNGQNLLARSTYGQILKEISQVNMQSDAHFSLAEMDFRAAKYREALVHYDAVIANSTASQRGLAAYRRAWSLINIGDVDSSIEALFTILRTPELLNRDAIDASPSIDAQFQQEVAHDLATFLAKIPYDKNRINELMALSGHSYRAENAQYLAVEYERVGRLKDAVEVWEVVNRYEAIPEKRIEGSVRLASLLVDQGRRQEALEKFHEAINGWRGLGTCSHVVCDEIHRRLRAFVIDFNKKEAKGPSLELLTMYTSYLDLFTEDYEMLMWAAAVSEQRKEWVRAAQFLRRSTGLAQMRLQNVETQASAKDTLEWKNRLESALRGSIQVAEKSSLRDDLIEAYDSYLKQSLLREKVDEVRYQRAYALSEVGNDKESSLALYQLAVDDKVSAKLRALAADLHMDILAQKKNDKEIEKKAQEYALLFPARAGEFAKLERQAQFNIAAQFAASDMPITSQNDAMTASVGGQAQNENLAQAWGALSRIRIADASKDERELYYRNRLLLAEKMGRYDEGRRAANELLQIADKDSEVYRMALARQAWFAELGLDFQEALKAQIKLDRLRPFSGKQWLNVALLAELADRNPTIYLSRFIAEEADGPDKVAAIEKLFYLAKSEKEAEDILSKYFKTLKNQPQVYGKLALHLLGKYKNYQKLTHRFKLMPELKATSQGKILGRYLALDSFKLPIAKTKNHKLLGETDHRLAKSLNQRINLLGEIEKSVRAALSGGDWTLQVVTLSQLGKEYERFYNDIMTLPVPTHLNEEEGREYLRLLSNQAGPYRTKAMDLKAKVDELWATPHILEGFKTALAKASAEEKELLKIEIEAIGENAPASMELALNTLTHPMAIESPLPTLEEVEAARSELRKSPFNLQAIENLQVYESIMDRKAMVSYLQHRRAQAETMSGAMGLGALEENSSSTKSKGESSEKKL